MDADRRLLISCLDLTSLGDDDDEHAIEELCRRAVHPAVDDGVTVAAVCVWPRFVADARSHLAGTPVRVAAATGGFPLPERPIADRTDEIRAAIADGADEVDVPVNRFLVDEPDALAGELRATRKAAGAATWKAIVETGALAPAELEILARAALDGGADFLKTSTGKGPQGATPAAVEALARTVAGTAAGLKVSGGVRGAGQATNYLEVVREVLGRGWPTPATFRVGASALLDALLA